jgi:hypothetical protein
MEFQLAIVSMLGTRMVYKSGLLPKFKNLNRKAYWVMLVLYLIKVQGITSVNRTELVFYLDKYIGRIYPSDLSTLLRRLSAEKFITYERYGKGSKSHMRISLANRGFNAIEDLDIYLEHKIRDLKRPAPVPVG